MFKEAVYNLNSIKEAKFHLPFSFKTTFLFTLKMFQYFLPIQIFKSLLISIQSFLIVLLRTCGSSKNISYFSLLPSVHSVQPILRYLILWGLVSYKIHRNSDVNCRPLFQSVFFYILSFNYYFVAVLMNVTKISFILQ